jgi:hypothetical protein
LICRCGQALGTEQGFCSIPNVLLLRHCWSGAGLGLLEVLLLINCSANGCFMVYNSISQVFTFVP